ncbi:MAG: GIY-YIG nuclease family protein [Gammaproteobacteria bacterium]
MQKEACAAYIMTNEGKTVLYTGVTTNLIKRVWEHRQGFVAGFSRKYRCRFLAYYELHDEWESAVRREKQIKAWKREWKERLIADKNPDWKDLYAGILG